MNLKPFKDSVAIRPESADKVSKSGLKYEFNSDSNGIGTILAVNDKSEKFTAADVGKRVLFIRYQHTNVLLDGEQYVLSKEDDVLGFIEE